MLEEKFWIFFFWICEKKLFIKKFEKNIDFGKKFAMGGEFWVGWLVRGVEMGGSDPQKGVKMGSFAQP